ncbi:amino acid transmembrane transporter [Aureococcus anophagefferens]|nr:amino acid transmembrane transporter [Aureococcus anophagefferens]
MSSGERVKKSSKVKDAATGVEVAIPAPPKKLSSWTTFFRLRNNDVARANPQLAQKGVMELLGTMWKDVGPAERADLDARAEREFKRKQKEWDAGRDEREFERMQAAKALGLALSTSWEDLVDAVRRRNGGGAAVAEKRRGPRGSPAKKKVAVLNGLDAIFAMATEEKNFEHFGNDMVQCFFDVATNILETVVGIYCMERVGVSSHKLKEDVKRAVDCAGEYAAPDGEPPLLPYGPVDYLGWDPARCPGGPPDDVPEVLSGETASKYRTLCNSLIHSYYAERASVDIGCAYAEVLAHLRTLRPYRGPADLPWDAYVDQCYLVTHVVFTLNNWGELALEPDLLPHEHAFIKEHIGIAIRERDVHLVGEYVECLRCFGATDADASVQLGITFLLNAQDQATHRWDVDMDAYTSYHATMVASQALLAHSFRGYGPGLLGAVDVLDKWRAADCPEDLPPATAPPPAAAAAARPSPKAAAKPSPKAAAPAKKRPLEDAAAAAPEKKKKAAAPRAARQRRPRRAARRRRRSSSPPPKAPSTPKAPPMPAGDVEGINGELAAAAAPDHGAAIRLVKRLNDSHITVGVMKSTSIGKTVAELKKAPDKKLAMAAKALVASWKQAVRDAAANAVPPEPQNVTGERVEARELGVGAELHLEDLHGRERVGPVDVRARHVEAAGLRGGREAVEARFAVEHGLEPPVLVRRRFTKALRRASSTFAPSVISTCAAPEAAAKMPTAPVPQPSSSTFLPATAAWRST